MNNKIITSKETNHFLIKNWLNLFLLTIFCYSHFIFYFLWGNHDWEWVKSGTPLLSGIFEGRFSQFILQTIISNGNILPIITIFTAIAFFTGAIILLLNIFKLPHKKLYYILTGLFISTSPYTISWLYFAFITLSCLSWPFFIILGYSLLFKAQNSKHKFLLRFCSCILFYLSIGGYPPTINLIGIIFFSIIINYLCFNKQTIKNIIKKATPMALSIICALILLLITQYLLKKYNLQYSTYNTAGISIQLLPQKLLETFIISLKQFIITTTFIAYQYKYLTLCLTLLALFCLYNLLPKTLFHIVLFSLSLLGLLISSVFTTFIAENTVYVTFEPRIEFFGILYIYALSIITLLKYSNTFLKNITILLTTILLIYNINTLSYASKIWNFGFKTETQLANRIINTIEEHEQFSQQNKYTFIQGGTLNIRGKYYQHKPDEKIDSYTLSAPLIPWHLPSKTYKFYTSIDYFGADFDIYWSYVNPYEINMSDNLAQYLNHKAKPWPNKDAIYLDNKTIILSLTQDGIWRGQNWFETHY